MQDKHRSNGVALPWVIVAGVFSLLISVVPFWGYYVHGGRDQQWYFLVILGCWLVSPTIGLGMIILALVWLKKHRPYQLAALGFGVALLVVTVFAWGGVTEGFIELVAG